MTNTPYQQMAKEFMDLWQKQIASVVSDKQFIGAMLDMLKTANPKFYDSTKHSSAHSADASDADGRSLAELAFRVAMCEKRLAALESGRKSSAAAVRAKGGKKPAAAKAGKSSGRGSKKPRS